MKFITLIIGLPGSGKTHLAQEIIKQYPGMTLLDDMSRDSDEKIELGQEAGDLVITDPNICAVEPLVAVQRLREWFGDYTLEAIPFEIDIDQCLLNLRNRDDNRFISRSSLVALAKRYTPDLWGRPRAVWKG